jgi:hypothetical protein
MMRRLAVLTAVLSLCSVLAADDTTKPSKSTVEGVELMIKRKLDDKNYPFSGAITMLSIMVSNPDKQFIGVDPSSKVSELKDDKGTSLLSTGFFKPTFNPSPRIAVDRKSVIVSLNTSAAPTKGAVKIHLKGELVLLSGTEEKTTDEVEVSIKPNAETKIGDFSLKVTMEKGFGTNGASFSLVSTKPNIKSINIKDAAGKVVETFPGFSYGFGKSWTWNYTLKKAVDKPKISITWYTKEEKVTVPVEVEMGLGL